MRTFIENYLHFIKNCIRPPYKKLESLKSGFIENSNFENNRDPWCRVLENTVPTNILKVTEEAKEELELQKERRIEGFLR